MSPQFEFFIEALICRRVNYPDRPCLVIAISDVHTLTSRIVAEVIDIIPKIDGRDAIK
jgi:hypothetical protein